MASPTPGRSSAGDDPSSAMLEGVEGLEEAVNGEEQHLGNNE